MTPRICPICASHVAKGIRYCSACGSDLKQYRPVRSKAPKDRSGPLWRRLITSPWGLLIVGLGGFGLLYLGARDDLVLAQVYSIIFLLSQLVAFPLLLWMRTRGDFVEIIMTLHFRWLWWMDDESDPWLIAWLIVLLVSAVLGLLLLSSHGPAMLPWEAHASQSFK